MEKTREPGIIWQRVLILKVGVALILAILSSLAILSYIFIPKARGQLTFATAVVGGAAVIYAGYYAGISVKLAMEQAKMEHSFEMISQLNSLDMMKVKLLIESEASQKSVSPDALYKKICEDEKLLSAVSTILGLWEDVSIGIRFGYLNEDVLFYSLSFIVPFHFGGLRYFVDTERKGNNDPYLYCEVERLADAWKNNKSVLTGKVYTFS